MKELIIVAGPTAVGKSLAAINLSKRINGSVISADSMQVYRGMDIGTAKVTKEEMQGIPHYLIDVLNPDEVFDVHYFKDKSKEALTEIYNHRRIPVMTGGTGFYIQSVLYDINFESEEDNTQIRKELEEISLSDGGIDILYEKLRTIDPESFQLIHKNNVKRVIRAIEFYELNGYRISEHNAREKMRTSPYNNAYFVLNDDREYLYKRCDLRVDKMIEDGLLDEVRVLYEKGYDINSTAMQGLGYKEILKHFMGELSLDEAIYIIKRDTRHFVKRQITYFKREKDAVWIDARDYDRDSEKIAEELERICNERGII